MNNKCSFCKGNLKVKKKYAKCVQCNKNYIWSDLAYDYDSKCTFNRDGTISFEKVGTWVVK